MKNGWMLFGITIGTGALIYFCMGMKEQFRQNRTAQYVRTYHCKNVKYWPKHLEWSRDKGATIEIPGASGYDCGNGIFIVIPNNEVQP